MALAPAASEDAVASLPASLPLEVIGTDEEDYAKADPADLLDETENAGEDENLEEGPLAIGKILLREVNRGGQWRDVKGRSFKHKPSAKGAYLNNDVPVIVK